MNKIVPATAILVTFLTTGCSTVNKANHNHPDYEKRMVHEVISDSEHQDKVHLKGQITGKVKCGTFNFEDEHGKTIQIRIDADEIPEKGLIFNSPTTIHGEVMKVPDQPAHIDTDKVHYFF